MSEPQVMRHFLRLSQLNFAQALQFYPLGSCTMKYNPPLNDESAAMPGFAGLHPLTPAHLAQGALELMARLEAALAEISGMDAVSLHPAAGAHGELAGLLMIRAYHLKHGRPRHQVIIPDTAHGTNPASSALAGFEVIVAKSNQRGCLEAAEIKRLMSDDVAALMVTNPSTLGIFEPEIREIADGSPPARRPALSGRRQLQRAARRRQARRHGRRRGAVQSAQDVLDAPRRRWAGGRSNRRQARRSSRSCRAARIVRGPQGWRLDSNRTDSIGKLRSFFGNFGMLVRAYAYILALGGDGLEQVSQRAILSASYVRERLREHFPSATGRTGHARMRAHS